MKAGPFLTRVILKNYKSIAACDVEFGSLTFLVGPNGSGKSNFLDALRFVADALRTSLDHALRDRGGINEVRRRSGGHPTHFGMRLEFTLPEGVSGHYAFRIGARPQGGHEVQEEECFVNAPRAARFRIESGEIRAASQIGPAASRDRLYLLSASGLPEYRPVFEAFSGMGFYNLNPDRIRDLQPPDSGELLARDGSNITSVLRLLGERNPLRKKRIEDYLMAVVPGIQDVNVRQVGNRETLEFRQEAAGARDSWRFFAANMSDGTLRALGMLVSLFQSGNGEHARVPLVGIEEPEVALHPAAAGAVLDALREASHETQVLITSHSPDLLDSATLDTELILAVHIEKGATVIAPMDEASLQVLRQGLYTPGELLRLNQLQPDSKLFGERTRQLHLFDEAPV